MNKVDLLETLEATRQTFHHAIEGLSDEQLTQPDLIDRRSIRDIIFHLTRWEGETVTLLFQARQGAKPNMLHFQKNDEDELNLAWQLESQNRPLDLVMSDFEGVRKQSLRRVAEFSDEELDKKGYFPWLKNHSLSELIISYVVMHEQEHAAQILTWRKENRVGV